MTRQKAARFNLTVPVLLIIGALVLGWVAFFKAASERRAVRGGEVTVGPHHTPEKPLTVRFSGRMKINNFIGCSQPWIDWYGPENKITVEPGGGKTFTYIRSPPGKEVEVKIWLIRLARKDCR